MQYRCQACGFQVFNRRYPKCESCGVDLAPGLALTPDERAQCLAAERVADLKQAALRPRTAGQPADLLDTDAGPVAAHGAWQDGYLCGPADAAPDVDAGGPC